MDFGPFFNEISENFDPKLKAFNLLVIVRFLKIVRSKIFCFRLN